MKLSKQQKIGLIAVPVIIGLYFIYKQFKNSGSDTKFKTIPPNPKPPVDEIPKSVTTRSGTRLRSSSSTSSNVLQTYPAGVVMTVIGSKNESDGLWYQVQQLGGQNQSGIIAQGWMRCDVVDK